MTIEMLSLGLDVLILLGLATTIYFALRLSRSLGNFRKQRTDFERIMRHLNENIERAHLSLAELKGFSGSFDSDIQVALAEAKTLLDELRMMNQSGNSLADRLESLASQSKYINQANMEHGSVRDLRSKSNGAESDSSIDQKLYDAISVIEKQGVYDDVAPGDDGFSIQDKDYGSGSSVAGRSRAEEELMQALKRNDGLSG